MSHGRRSIVGKVVLVLAWVYATSASIFVVLELLGSDGDWGVVAHSVIVDSAAGLAA